MYGMYWDINYNSVKTEKDYLRKVNSVVADDMTIIK
jgi:hypothetical protein